jgi:biotin-dependent carboxylase-like uncharacterized protein
VIALEVLHPGPLALVEDLGRPGLAEIGVTHSGAADRGSHTLANRLLANPEGCATIEITQGGFRARVHGGTVAIAVTGADAGPAIEGIPFGTNSVRYVNPGQVISLGTPVAGLRSYLGVRGGIAVPAVLGSRSHDTLSGLGPPPLRAGDTIPVGEPAGRFPDIDQAPIASFHNGPVALRVIPGPRDGWFTDPDALVGATWVISERSNRVGIRLAGPPLRLRWPDRQLPSEGATRGAVQVPPNGQPVILGPDHPVTGGYPVIGVVADSDTDLLAQLRPGQPVRLHWDRPRIPAPATPGW